MQEQFAYLTMMGFEQSSSRHPINECEDNIVQMYNFQVPNLHIQNKKISYQQLI
jgi:hypothetical protein